MTMPSPFASFDALSIAGALSRSYQSTSLGEIQSVSYLACILSVYDGQPSSEWGYEFAVTETSSPFSVSILNAVDRLEKIGFLQADDGRYSLSPEGDETASSWASMHRFKDRQKYLMGATGAADALPLPALSAGLLEEPQVASAIRLGVDRPLLGDVSLIVLHRYFQSLEESLGAGVDLLIPAVVWLTYLLEQDIDEEPPVLPLEDVQ